MTSLEHVLVKHALDRLPSWTGDVDGNGNGDVAATWDEVGVEIEEVGVGVAVTTDDDDEEQLEAVGIAVEQGPPRSEDGNWEDEEDGHSRTNVSDGGSGVSDGSGGSSGSRRSLRGVSPLGSALRSQSRSPSDSNSRSRSRSHSSVRGQLEMGESSAATSWTQADAEGVGAGERPSADGDSERRPGDGVCFRSSADGLAFGDEVIDVRAEAARGGIEMALLPRLRTGADGDVSRKEEVLVIQEEDIGEGWHPLRHNGKARSQDDGEDEGEKGEVEEDVGFVHAPKSARGRSFGSAGRNARHLRLEFKPPSPQPWEETDPPTDNNDMYASDYYSTLNSKKFGMMQKSRQRSLIPHSTYYFGPPPSDSAFGTAPIGQIGVHHPREIVRIERDYMGGELTQFSPVFPLELEGRVTPTQFHQTINDINEILISAYSVRHGFVDNFLAVVTLQLSTLIMTSHYTKEMRRLKRKIEEFNTQLYNPVGLHILWPQKVAFLFLEIEYY